MRCEWCNGKMEKIFEEKNGVIVSEWKCFSCGYVKKRILSMRNNGLKTASVTGRPVRELALQ